MADFSPPFAHDADKRPPTNDEVDNGFPCGAADQLLFNWLFYSVQSEIGNVITYAGLTPENNTFTQLREAIVALIAAATGETSGGDTSNFVLMDQARTRLPIFPDVQTVDGKITVVSTGAANVRVPAGVTFMHRGIYPIVTVQTDLVTDASKTYHLRWNKVDGFTLKDLASGVYNPGALAETSVNFDSTYDDMLVARVVTSAGNVPTITNLVNLDRLMTTLPIVAVNILDPITSQARGDVIATLNWARTPKQKSWSMLQANYQGIASGISQNDFDTYMYPLGGWPSSPLVGGIPGTRYQIAFTLALDFVNAFEVSISAGA